MLANEQIFTPGTPILDQKRGRLWAVVVRIARIFAYAGMFLLLIPVILLPVATEVPPLVWIALLGIDLVIIGLSIWFRRTRYGLLAGFIGALGLALMSISASQFFTFTPPILDSSGRSIPGSIATLEKVDLNGSEQWISIRGKDTHSPVILFLAGGPGGSQLVTARRVLAGLEDRFVVVNWEQPGAGKSFNAVDDSSLSLETYISDGLELTTYLQERFDTDRIYLLGESWGSALGVLMAQREPESFYAFIGTGQMVAFTETDLICYEFVLALARERGDTKKISQLESQGPPPYFGAGVAMKQAAYLLETYDYMNENPVISDDGFNTFQDLAGPEYGLVDKVNWFRGALETMDVVYPQLWGLDLRRQAPELDVPVYLLLGRHDINAPPALAEEYLELLDAPQKELVWFEHSGHNPWVNETDRFVDVIRDISLSSIE